MDSDYEPYPSEFEDPLSNYDPIHYSTELKRALAEETVSSIQMQPYAYIEADTPIREAMQTLYDLNVSSVMIVEDGRLVGIVTERDILEKVAERLRFLETIPVREVMTANPLVVYDCDPVGTALAAIATAGYRHVPVLNMSDQLIGNVSPRRVFDFLETRFDLAPD